MSDVGTELMYGVLAIVFWLGLLALVAYIAARLILRKERHDRRR